MYSIGSLLTFFWRRVKKDYPQIHSFRFHLYLLVTIIFEDFNLWLTLFNLSSCRTLRVVWHQECDLLESFLAISRILKRIWFLSNLWISSSQVTPRSTLVRQKPMKAPLRKTWWISFSSLESTNSLVSTSAQRCFTEDRAARWKYAKPWMKWKAPSNSYLGCPRDSKLASPPNQSCILLTRFGRLQSARSHSWRITVVSKMLLSAFAKTMNLLSIRKRSSITSLVLGNFTFHQHCLNLSDRKVESGLSKGGHENMFFISENFAFFSKKQTKRPKCCPRRAAEFSCMGTINTSFFLLKKNRLLFETMSQEAVHSASFEHLYDVKVIRILQWNFSNAIILKDEWIDIILFKEFMFCYFYIGPSYVVSWFINTQSCTQRMFFFEYGRRCVHWSNGESRSCCFGL